MVVICRKVNKKNKQTKNKDSGKGDDIWHQKYLLWMEIVIELFIAW